MSERVEQAAVVPLSEVQPQALAPVAGIDIGNGVVATLPECMKLAQVLGGAVTLPQHYRKPADIMAAVLTAAQLRLPLMTVINGTHVINGKVTLSADLMAGVARGSGQVREWAEEELDHGYRVSATRTDGTSLSVTFTDDDAKAAGLTGGNWQKFRKDMLRARSVSRLCRRLFPDILAGMYSDEEMRDARPLEPAGEHQVDLDTDDEPEPEPQPTDPQTRRKARAMIRDLDKQFKDPEADPRELDESVTMLRAWANEEYRAGRLRPDGETAAALKSALADFKARLAADDGDPFDGEVEPAEREEG